MTAGQEITQPGEFGKRSETSSKLTALARGVLVEIAGYHMINLQYSQRIGSPTGLAAVLNQTLDDTELFFPVHDTSLPYFRAEGANGVQHAFALVNPRYP